MNRLKAFIAITLLINLSACVTTAPDPATSSAVIAVANTAITCSSSQECTEKWSRASTWIAQNAAYKVQTATDSLIQTMGPLPDDPRPAYTVTKTAEGNNSYNITLNGGCDNIFGCIPNITDSRARFSIFVNAASQGTTPKIMHKGPAIGIQIVPVAPDVASQLKLDSARGLVVYSVVADSLASKAGIVRNDVILSADGRDTNTTADFMTAFDLAAKKHKIELVLWHEGEQKDISIALPISAK